MGKEITAQTQEAQRVPHRTQCRKPFFLVFYYKCSQYLLKWEGSFRFQIDGSGSKGKIRGEILHDLT